MPSQRRSLGLGGDPRKQWIAAFTPLHLRPLALVGIFCFLMTVGNQLYHERSIVGKALSPFLSEPSKIIEDQVSMRNEHPYSDYTRDRYCKDKKPCIALMSSTHHGGIWSMIDQHTLGNTSDKSLNHYATVLKTPASDLLAQRVLMRQAYCAIHGCDVIMDYNQYNEDRTMWLNDKGKHKEGPMPPHWNKVAALQRWLPHFDAVVLMDMDTTIVDFNINIHDLYNSTSTIYSNGNVQLVMFKKGGMSQCVVDTWWSYGTGPGCRYFKYPENYRSQTINLDMPWFWYSMSKCAEIYQEGEPYECLNTCNGPANYTSDLEKHPNYTYYKKMWVHECYLSKRKQISEFTQAIESQTFQGKFLVLEMQWGNRLNFTESIKRSLAVHLKDQKGMPVFLNQTVEVLRSFGCTLQSCSNPNVDLMRTKLQSWSQTFMNEIE